MNSTRWPHPSPQRDQAQQRQRPHTPIFSTTLLFPECSIKSPRFCHTLGQSKFGKTLTSPSQALMSPGFSKFSHMQHYHNSEIHAHNSNSFQKYLRNNNVIFSFIFVGFSYFLGRFSPNLTDISVLSVATFVQVSSASFLSLFWIEWSETQLNEWMTSHKGHGDIGTGWS